MTTLTPKALVAKALLLGLLCGITVPLFASPPRSNTVPERSEKLAFDWKFSLSDSPTASEADHDDSNWQTVTVPHDWSILGPYAKTNPSGGQGGYLPTGTGWYRKEIKIQQIDEDKQYLILFDGSYMNTEV